MRAVALIDGEHYAPVVRDALARASVRVGRRDPRRRHREAARRRRLRRAARRRLRRRGASSSTSRTSPCSGRPSASAGPSRALAAGLPYVGADFRFDPPASRAVRAAVDRGDRHRQARREDGGHGAPRAAAGPRPRRRRRRDGPRRPGRAGGDRGAAVGRRARRALALGAACGVGPSRDRSARRRADDRLPPRGRRARRGGLHVERLAGARLAAARAPDVVVFDGSGAAIPPIDVDRRVLVVGTGHDVDAYLNLYRRLISDLVVASAATSPARSARAAAARRPAPLEGRVAVFTAGATPTSRISTPTSCTSRRISPTARLCGASSTRLDADTYLVELKAAAIDVVAEHALAHGKRVVLARERRRRRRSRRGAARARSPSGAAREPAPPRRAAAARRPATCRTRRG